MYHIFDSIAIHNFFQMDFIYKWRSAVSQYNRFIDSMSGEHTKGTKMWSLLFSCNLDFIDNVLTLDPGIVALAF